jgi:hypothetical protein
MLTILVWGSHPALRRSVSGFPIRRRGVVRGTRRTGPAIAEA